MKKILFIFLTFLLTLTGCLNSEASQKEVTPKKVQPISTNPSNEEKPKKEKQYNGNPQVKKVIHNVPLIKQRPELPFGCEVTSTAMMLQYAGVHVSKMDLYKAVKKDDDPIVIKNGDILQWGDPSEGFVGDMTGKTGRGYAVFDEPIEDLVNQFLPGRAINLTNEPFEKILNHIKNGYPVVVWTTGDYRLPNQWEEWMHNGKKIKTPIDLHVVTLVGFDQHFVYLNDPLSGKKNEKVNKHQFIQSWKALQSRAVSYY